MVGRKWDAQDDSQSVEQPDGVRPKGFDDYEVSLGDLLRGERATMGKSLLDVQRELKIRASYIAAIENSDPTAFDSPGFIAGYVRSYARYLKLAPEEIFDAFCKESGFQTAHGMSAAAAGPKADAPLTINSTVAPNQFENTSTPFIPVESGVSLGINAGAIGSVVALCAVLVGLGYGGWSLVQEIQKVQVAPVEQTPLAASNVDPFSGAQTLVASSAPLEEATETARAEALDRLYRPPALDVPVLVARDAPIATLDPASVGAFAPAPEVVETSPADMSDSPGVQVVEAPRPEVVLLAVAPTWVRIRSADNSILFEKILDAGEEYEIPVTEETPVLRAGNSGSLYFRVNGDVVGPAGEGTTLVKDVMLASEDLSALYSVATPAEDQALFDLLDELDAPAFPRPEGVLDPTAEVIEASLSPEASVPEDVVTPEGVTLFAIRPAWVRVSDGNNRLFERILEPGEVYAVPFAAAEPVLRSGNSGALFMRTPEGIFGPVAPGSAVARRVDLRPEAIAQTYAPVDVTADPDFLGIYNDIDFNVTLE